ncbi:MAG: hypothetical protein MPEBLZ_04013 [Candidatus Methanoperedens nitroreducens]|uniref:Uncharacterized protein n=1 Tax=Candidatus Methanoperedens nitratireducens TaxID=1392998 RepID=A0A0P7ZAD0_9EURY|nr:hypothetical protein [Candidatus Methanoperedens sp. BLZ2]KAB2945918.1 MAG: hypothetical protein F9K14_09390 [Candidatus Methanoperedens sp.]KPQ41438.1 MAG: hypothetical protein MPEBLZ_04013 [Candidatus Methanoperedens sp. BLZ1]MBZ0174371.1 hypothetical protein [Candidatus Methanoperedens nitroreducens]MCX9079904.1 hypothetical protein [Candidatus Methanoperedens sp.]MCX9086340.1 hypothetical protein [Candidatus Methanoperedens sp.]
MLTKTKISIVFVILAGLIGTGLLFMQTNGYNSGEISYSSGDVAFNVTDDRELVSFADNVFIGKVIAQTGNKANTPPPEAGDTPGFSPQTQFSIEVVENIKGNLSGMIIVSQYGGYKEKGGVNELHLIEGDKLLEPGNTHLFATRFNDIDGWHTIIVPNCGNLPVTNQTDHQNKVERFKKAYSQEIPSKF